MEHDPLWGQAPTLLDGRAWLATAPLGDGGGAMDDEEGLDPAMIQWAGTFPPRRRAEILAGRVALRKALSAAGCDEPGSGLPDGWGRPGVPPGFTGSLTHKSGLALAAVARSDGWTLGLDSEDLGDRPRPSIASRILGQEEHHRWIDGGSRWEELLWAFSVKEAIYKAAHPWAPRYIGFHEAVVIGSGPELNLRPGEPTVEVKVGHRIDGERLICWAWVRARVG